MNTKNDGGSAFPSLKSSRPATEDGLRRTDGLVNHFNDGGMTLRDYFAAKAMGIAYTEGLADEPFPSDNTLAKRSYEMADAMLAARGDE